MRTLTAIAVVLWLSPRVALGDGGDALSDGVELYKDLEYEKAVAVLAVAASDVGLERDARLRALKYLGLAHTALGADDAARDAFRRLLEIDPDFSLGADDSPRARGLLEEARLDLDAEVTIEVRSAPTGASASSPVTIELRLSDPSRLVAGVIVHYASGESSKFDTVQATRVSESGDFAATIPSAFVRAPLLGYYVTAFARGGEEVASLGSPAEPFKVAIAALAGGEAPSILKSPYFWAGVGVVALGSGVAAYFLLRDSQADGFITIRPN